MNLDRLVMSYTIEGFFVIHISFARLKHFWSRIFTASIFSLESTSPNDEQSYRCGVELAYKIQNRVWLSLLLFRKGLHFEFSHLPHRHSHCFWRILQHWYFSLVRKIFVINTRTSNLPLEKYMQQNHTALESIEYSWNM